MWLRLVVAAVAGGGSGTRGRRNVAVEASGLLAWI